MSKPHPERVPEYLRHIIDAIRRASAYASRAQDAAAFEGDGLLQDAVIRNIEIIGEAANKVRQADPLFVQAHPQIPWDAMRAMRSKVIHDYFEVDCEVVWRTVKQDLPGLAQQIEKLLG